MRTTGGRRQYLGYKSETTLFLVIKNGMDKVFRLMLQVFDKFLGVE